MRKSIPSLFALHAYSRAVAHIESIPGLVLQEFAVTRFSTVGRLSREENKQLCEDISRVVERVLLLPVLTAHSTCGGDVVVVVVAADVVVVAAW